MPGFIGVPELLLLGLVALFIFGPKRLPEMGRSLGNGMREFKDSISNHLDKDDTADALAIPVEEHPPLLGAVDGKRREVA